MKRDKNIRKNVLPAQKKTCDCLGDPGRHVCLCCDCACSETAERRKRQSVIVARGLMGNLAFLLYEMDRDVTSGAVAIMAEREITYCRELLVSCWHRDV